MQPLTMFEPASLLICRYWAFGPGCPDASKGTNTCKFAHWDSGTLASHLTQRGTCRFWLKGTCRHGHKCWYEHRKTGVEGLLQGPISLYGFNLQIANAAAKAGFNTWDHVGLFNLIWEMKRIVLRHTKAGNINHPPPPKDAYYPERYRPSGLGDNTKRKRPSASSHLPDTVQANLESIIKGRTRAKKPKVKNNRNEQPLNRPAGGFGTQGTQEHPVDLLSYDEVDEARQGPKKRQRLDLDRANQRSRFANTSLPRAAIDNSRRNVRGAGSFTQQSDFVSLDAYHNNNQLYASNNLATDNRIDKTHVFGAIPVQTLAEDLRRVKASLKASAGDMGSCMATMSGLFEKYPEILGQDVMMPLLRALRENFEKVETAALAGADVVGEVIRLVA